MKKDLTLEENIQEIVKAVKVNNDHVGNNGMMHVQVNISFLNMVGLIVKFFFAVLVASPIIFIIFMILIKIAQTMMGLDFAPSTGYRY